MNRFVELNHSPFLISKLQCRQYVLRRLVGAAEGLDAVRGVAAGGRHVWDQPALSFAAGLTSVVRAQAGGCGNFSDDHRLDVYGNPLEERVAVCRLLLTSMRLEGEQADGVLDAVEVRQEQESDGVVVSEVWVPCACVCT